MPLIQIQSGAVAFGHVPLLDGVDLVIEDRERLCLIGRNGTGKSTLLKIIAGSQALDSGNVWRSDGLRIATLEQAVPDAATATLFDVVAAGLGDHSKLLQEYHAASANLADPNVSEKALADFADLQAKIEAQGAWEGSERIDATLSRLRLDPDARLADCSGGVRRRAMLGQALVAEPDLLLLDEPTNHLDIESIKALEDALISYRGSVLFITHDRALIESLATRIIELDRGRLVSFPGSYSAYQTRKAALLEAEADQDRKFDTHLAQEEAWIRQGIKARRTRNEGRVRRLEALREERAARRDVVGKAALQVSSGDASGKRVIEVDNVHFSHGEDTLIAPFSTLIQRGDRIGIIGPNGSGKTTLLRLLLGDLAPNGGTVTRGTKLSIAYFDQERVQLDPEQSVRDNVAEGSDQLDIGGRSRHVISYLGDFLFPPARVHSPVKTLSGGERNRLMLAKLFVKPSNLLVLDEPTNDLDIETLELLEALLSEYDGTLLVVSHDRSFLDRTVTSTLSIDPQGQVRECVGGYSDWLTDQQRRDPKQTKQEPAPTKAAAKPRSNKRERGSQKDQRELAALPAKIEALETDIAEQQQRIALPAFYDQPKAAIDAGLAELQALEDALSQAYERWETLENAAP
ncbi:MAG: ATP-binding cassette domain-containing protein [Pseudomonadales bacterium]